MKNEHLLVSLWLVVSTLSLAQPLASLQTVNRLSLPTTAGRVIAALGQYSRVEFEDWDNNPGGWGTRYVWTRPGGLLLTAQSDGQTDKPNKADEVRAIFLKAARGQVVGPLVYGLVLNKTTKAACQQQFGQSLKPVKAGGGLMLPGAVYKLTKDGLFTYLSFNRQGILTEICRVTFALEAAG